MRRADRLFRIVQILRRGRISTASRLALELEVSERTVYRDIADLVASGVPIRGEAGVGYAIDRGYDLPPLMFTTEEIEALVLGARMVESWCGEELASAAKDVLTKVDHVLPRRHRDRLAATALFVPSFGWTLPGAEMLADLRIALRDLRKIRVVSFSGALLLPLALGATYAQTFGISESIASIASNCFRNGSRSNLDAASTIITVRWPNGLIECLGGVE